MTTIFVAKLDFGVTDNELLNLFQQYGTVNKVTVAKDKETNKSRGFAFVEMPNAEEAKTAISNLDGHQFNGRACVIKEADERPNNRESRPAGGDNRFQRDNREGGFKPRTDSSNNREQKPFQRTGSQTERPTRGDDFKLPIPDDDGETPAFAPLKPVIVKKKKEADKPKPFDNTADGKNKKQKMNAYRKSGKDNQFLNDEDEDEEIDLFGINDEDEEFDDDYSKYLVNNDDDEDFDDDYDDEEWDDDDEEWDDED